MHLHLHTAHCLCPVPRNYTAWLLADDWHQNNSGDRFSVSVSTTTQQATWGTSVLQACTAKMNLSEEVDLEDYVGRPDKISNAEISAICQEAGMHAVRKNR